MIERHHTAAYGVDARELADFLARIRARHGDDVVFVCIGTDRSSGDSLGPLAGSRLEAAGYANVCGTLREPCDANTLRQRLASLPPGKAAIAIDACLGRSGCEGSFVLREGPLEPARSVGGRLPAVGAYSVGGIVAAAGPRPYAILQSASLYRVMNMAEQIAEAVFAVWPPRGNTI